MNQHKKRQRRGLGLIRLPARGEAARIQSVTAGELVPDVAVEFVERRTLERVRVALEVSAWSPLDPTRLAVGETVDLTTSGSLLRLPGLSVHAAVVDLRINLPEQTISVRAGVLRRQAPDLFSVVFEKISPEAREQLADFLRWLSAQAAEEALQDTRKRRSLLWWNR